jgi:membrane-associated protease RseP (regulator of RpoE activity)
MNEVYHYPFLCVGWFGLLVTSLNLIPVGQLDGGHITQALLGLRSKIVSTIALLLMLSVGLIGLLPYLGFPNIGGWPGWILWAGILWVTFRKHQPQTILLSDTQPVGTGRIALTFVTAIILFFSSAMTPISFVD